MNRIGIDDTRYIENARTELAEDFVNHTGMNIFLTGKAGTGKTTFLHQLRQKSFKRLVVTAPTGVAAINAGGVTLHSFFQLAFGPQIPGAHSYEVGYNKQKFRFNKKKIRLIQSIDLLVIDEVSMVRADVMDAVDSVLRKFRDRSRPFGGVQLLMIGDMHQLAPVVKDQEWEILQEYYPNMFFFSSRALNEAGFVSIELDTIYRQNDPLFIRLLAGIRNNTADESALGMLNRRFIPDFNPPDEDGYIRLTTHNALAREINQRKMEMIDEPAHEFRAVTQGEFPGYAYPTDEILVLKKGAQVMFVKNDSSYAKRYYNGKIGRIVDITDDQILVRCNGDEEDIEAGCEEWKNVSYFLDEQSGELREQTAGTFTQLPVKPAWAITIHKSQGLTFQRAIIDAAASFAHGQVYVALSRCRSLDGLVLSSRISAGSIINDNTIRGFTENIRDNIPDGEILFKARKKYETEKICEIFGFQEAENKLSVMIKLAEAEKQSLHGSFLKQLTEMSARCNLELFIPSVKFKSQILRLASEPGLPSEQLQLRDRIIKASAYFSPLCKTWFQSVGSLVVETDNKALQKLLTGIQTELMQLIFVKTRCIECCAEGFDNLHFLKTLMRAETDSGNLKPTPVKVAKIASGADEPNEKIIALLKKWRNQKAEESGVPEYMIFPLKTIHALAALTPGQAVDLRLIPGLGKRRTEKFGDEILGLMNAFWNFNTGSREPVANTRNKGEESAEISFEMFGSGLSPGEIALKRDLSVSTIILHLEKAVASGRLPVNQLVDEEKINTIREFFVETGSSSLKEAREILGGEYDFTELRLVRASLYASGTQISRAED